MNPIWLTIEIILLAAVAITIVFLVRSVRAYDYNDSGWTVGLVVACIALLVFSGFSMISAGSVNGEGESTGTIVNHGTDGWSWNNRVVYLLRDGEVNADQFGIEQGNDQLWQQIAQAQEDKLRVRVHYHSSYFCWAWKQSDCTVTHRIEVLR